MIVEIDLFSGRPNPSWTPDEAQARHLVELLHRQAEIGSGPPPVESLGFRGFLIRLQTKDGWHLVRVGHGTTRIGETNYADPGHEIEASLIGIMPSALRRQYGGMLPNY